MSAAAVALFSGAIGTIVTVIVAYFGALKREYAARSGALKVVKSDFERAKDLLASSVEKGKIWPKGYQASSDVWHTRCAELVSRLSSKSWDCLHEVASELDVTDLWAEELREEKKTWATDFDTHLRGLEEKLPAVIGILDDSLAGARSRLVVGRPLGIGLATAIATFLVIAWPSGSAVTGSSLERAIEAESPAVTQAICDQSLELKGAYSCTVDVSPCNGKLEASTQKPTSCPAAQRELLEVTTNDSCFAPTLLKTLATTNSSSPSSKLPDWLRRKLVRSGCIPG